MHRVIIEIDGMFYSPEKLIAEHNELMGILKRSCQNCLRERCGYRVEPGQLMRFNCPYWRNENAQA